MAPAHYARTEPPQALPAPTDCTRDRRRSEGHAHQTELASGHKQTVSLRQELIYEVGRQQVEHVGRNEAVKVAIWFRYARGTVTLMDECAF